MLEIEYIRKFDLILVDSLEFLFLSMDYPSYDEQNQRFARSSIISSLLLIECAANICIASLNLEKNILNEIDRLPILGKFDFYLRVNFRKRHLNRGNHHIEIIKELKKIRDMLVHPKSHKLEVEIQPDGTGKAEAEVTRNLEVAYDPSFWDDSQALIILKAVHEFLEFFFKQQCKFSSTKTSNLLFSRNEIPFADGFIPCFKKSTKIKLLNLKINLSYLKLYWI